MLTTLPLCIFIFALPRDARTVKPWTLLLLVVACAAVGVGLTQLSRHNAASGPMCTEQATLVDTGGRATLVAKLQTRRGLSAFERVVAVDARTGAVIANARVPIGTSFLGAFGDDWWFSSIDSSLGIHRRSPTTLAPTLAQPAWATGTVVPSPRSVAFAFEGGLAFQIERGGWAKLDPRTLETSPLPGQHPPTASVGAWAEGHRNPTLATLSHPLAPTLSGGEAATLSCRGHAPSTQTYTRARFVSWSQRDRRRDPPPLVLGEGEFLVVHQRGLSDASLQLSRVGCDGAARFTLALDGTELVGAFAAPGGALLVVHAAADVRGDSGDVALLVDTDGGRLVWSRPL